MCAPKNSVKICVAKLIGLQEEINEPTVIAGDFRTFISVTDRSSRENISKDIVYLNSAINQLDLINIYRLFHPTRAECTFFSRSQGHSKEWTTFCSIKNIISWGKFKNYTKVLSEHCGIKLEIKSTKTARKPLKCLEIKSIYR